MGMFEVIVALFGVYVISWLLAGIFGVVYLVGCLVIAARDLFDKE